MWLVWGNFEKWGKDQRQRGTKHEESNRELHNRKHTVYKMPRKKKRVEEEVEDENSAVTVITRDWKMRDDKGLDNNIQATKRRIKDLEDGRAAQWTDITDVISPPVQAAVVLEPTYKLVESTTDTLGLYPLLEAVCTRNTRDNTETWRAKLVQHEYLDDEYAHSHVAGRREDRKAEKSGVGYTDAITQCSHFSPGSVSGTRPTSPADKRTLILSLLHPPGEGATSAFPSATPAVVVDTLEPNDAPPAPERAPTAPPSPTEESAHMAATGPAQTIGPNTDAHTSAVDDAAAPPRAPASFIPEVWVAREIATYHRKLKKAGDKKK
ncbi:hypothetical protein B484DRAFT_401966 [Ochromonadaceae sp. CCMP2298]|nr:hypothetical protein B484DRAFT_401966 [Ochromonadaceae sp. CCMP2298]